MRMPMIMMRVLMVRMLTFLLRPELLSWQVLLPIYPNIHLSGSNPAPHDACDFQSYPNRERSNRLLQ